jgi:hypothetical protein
MAIFSSKQNQNIYLNGQFISGVQSLGVSYDTNIIPSIAIQDTGFNYLVNDQNKAMINIEYIPSNVDPILAFTGQNIISGTFGYADKYLNFNSGYLTKYNIKTAIDNPIVCRADIDIYGQFAEQTGIINNNPINYSITPYDLCYTDITLNEALTNRLLSFDMTISTNRIPQYNIGEYYPTEVLINYPIKIDFAFELDIDNYMMSNMRSFLLNQEIRSIQINFKNYSTLNNILSFNFNNIVKNNDSLNLSVSDNGKVSVSFSTYILS